METVGQLRVELAINEWKESATIYACSPSNLQHCPRVTSLALQCLPAFKLPMSQVVGKLWDFTMLILS
jgi:hypothetical protein